VVAFAQSSRQIFRLRRAVEQVLAGSRANRAVRSDD
jgi:hypothetical protein